MGRRSGGLGSWVGIGKMSLTLLAVAAMMALLASCGDTVYEAKGGPGGSSGVPTGTINISVKDGAGQTTFRNKADSVTVTLLNDPRNQGFPTSVLVDNGGVTFTGLVAGTYAVRISKPGYATSYIEDLKLQNEQDYNDKNQDYYYLRTVTAVEDLYPLTAGLKGTLLYKKADNTTGPAAGATVRIVINNTKLADNRNATVTTDASGTFTFDDLPATGDVNYSVTALSKDFGSLLFVDSDLDNVYKKALRSGITTTLQTVTIYDTPVTGLRWTKAPISVEPEDAITVEFNDEIEPASINSGSVKVTLDGATSSLPRDVDVDGKTLTITPHGKWTGNLIVTFGTGLVAKNGGGVAGDLSIKIGVLTDDNALIVVNGDGSNVIWLADSTKPIELVFNKAIDKEKSLAASNYVNEPYSIEINEEKVTLSPSGGYWKSATPTLNLTGFKSADGKSYAANSQTIAGAVVPITVNTISIGTPDFAVKKTGAWVGQTLNIGLADSSKTIELALSDEIGTPTGGRTFRAYYVTTLPSSWNNNATDLTFLSAEFTGSTIKVEANPRWEDEDSYIVIENVRSARGVYLKGGSEPAGWNEEIAVVSLSVLARRPFYVLTSSIAFPGEFSTTPIVVEFSEPIDPKFLSGRLKVESYAAQFDPDASPAPTPVGNQLGDATVSEKTVTIKPLNGQSWISQYLTVTFESVGSSSALQSTEGQPLVSLGSKVYTTWSSATTDISDVKVEKFWVDEPDDPAYLRSSGDGSVSLKFVVARTAAGSRFGHNPADPSPVPAGWVKGSYVIEALSNGRVVSHTEFNNGIGGVVPPAVAWSLNRDTATVSVPTGFNGEKLGGKTLSFAITPKSGVSTGQTTIASDSVSGWIQLTNTSIGGVPFDVGDWIAENTGTSPNISYQALNSRISTVISDARNWVKTTGAANNRVEQAVFYVTFTEAVNPEFIEGTLDWVQPRRVDYDAISVVVWPATTFTNGVMDPTVIPTALGGNGTLTYPENSYVVYLEPTTNATAWTGFFEDMWTQGNLSGATLPNNLTTAVWSGTESIEFTRFSISLTNISNVGSGSTFGIAYEQRRKVVISETISISLDPEPIAGAAAFTKN